MCYKELYESEKKISDKFEEAIDALLGSNLEAYLMLREAKQFAEDQRKEIENARRIQNSNQLEEP